MGAIANTGIVSPEVFGAVGNGVANDRSALVQAFAAGGRVHLRPGKVYYCGGQTLPIVGPLHICGHGAEIRDAEITASGTPSGIVFEGVTFSTAVTSGAGLAPYLINLRNVDHITLRSCHFKGCLAYVAATDGSPHYGVAVENCRFTLDGSNFAWNTLQFDALTITGYRHVIVTGNRFDLTNVTRAMKLSVGPTDAPAPAYVPRGVFVSHNTIRATADETGGKQIVDCFSGTVQTVFSENWIKAYGFNRGIENKTGRAYAETDIAAGHKIVNNYIDMDACPVFFQGNFGATSYTQNSYDDLLIAGNTFRTETFKDGTLHVRFFNSVMVKDNHLLASGVADKHHMDIASCEDIQISDNNVRGGCIHIGKATTNSNDATFSGDVKRVTARGNIITDYDINGAIALKNITSGIESLIIQGNAASTTKDETDLLGAYVVTGCSSIAKALVQGNTATHSANGSKAKLVVSTSTVTSLKETDNSWEPA